VLTEPRQLLDPVPHYRSHGEALGFRPCAVHDNTEAYTHLTQILTGILRHYAAILMAVAPKPQDQKTTREQRSLLHGINLRTNYHVLSKKAFASRRDDLRAAYESGAYLKAPESRGQAPPNPMTDPNAMEGMMGMMKGNMAMIIPNTLIMSWINAFFSGYVISGSINPFPPRRPPFPPSVLPAADRLRRSETAFPFDHQV